MASLVSQEEESELNHGFLPVTEAQHPSQSSRKHSAQGNDHSNIQQLTSEKAHMLRIFKLMLFRDILSRMHLKILSRKSSLL